MTTSTAATPLTVLSEEEQMFRDAVADFAESEVRPRVAAMERAAAIDPTLVPKLFELGLMGIEIPERFGGAGGGLFMTTLAVEELSAVDASAAIFVDVQNTLVIEPFLQWASEEQQARYLPKLAADRVGAYALSEPESGSDAFGLQTKATRKGDGWVLDGRKLWITNGAEAGVYVIFANTDFAKGYKGITAFIVERGFKGFSVGKKEDKLGIRASSTTELILDGCEVPAANVLGEVGKGYKVAIETLNTGRIGIGAQMIGVARGALAAATQVRQGAQAVRQADRRIPGGAVPAGPGRHRARGGAPHGVQRRPAEGRGPGVHAERRDGEALLLAGGRAGDVGVRRAVRRLRLHQGVPGREVLPRRQDRDDLRRHEQHAAEHDRQTAPEIGAPMRLVGVAAALALLGPGTAAAQQFEGVVTIRTAHLTSDLVTEQIGEDPDERTREKLYALSLDQVAQIGGPADVNVMQFKGGRMRSAAFEMPGMGSTYMLLDLTAATLRTVAPSRRGYYETSLRSPSTPSPRSSRKR